MKTVKTVSLNSLLLESVESHVVYYWLLRLDTMLLNVLDQVYFMIAGIYTNKIRRLLVALSLLVYTLIKG